MLRTELLQTPEGFPQNRGYPVILYLAPLRPWSAVVGTAPCLALCIDPFVFYRSFLFVSLIGLFVYQVRADALRLLSCIAAGSPDQVAAVASTADLIPRYCEGGGRGGREGNGAGGGGVYSVCASA